MNSYQNLITRNKGLISLAAQEKISHTRVLIAGCGMGSTVAETLLRLGYVHLTLVDADTVEVHNLNRQNYIWADISNSKANALAQRLRSIYPAANIHAIPKLITPENAADLIQAVDLIIDTVDFIDLSAIVALHDACHKFKKPIVTAMNIGFGAGYIYFPANHPYTFRDLLKLNNHSSLHEVSYTEIYVNFLNYLKSYLATDVFNMIMNTLAQMESGKPCPASQVAVGTASISALIGTVATRIAENLPITAAPKMVILNLHEFVSSHGINIGDNNNENIQ